ncbi:toxin-antitoxin system YwqK family antitoxin [Sphingobacterium faecale]|uniref:Antitoxin component YwqK of YwqJK toxin-antitoxin module n=1 Tax=Sphingobacterium faecale TaxID=2803775 RepID=A0ABS1R7A4_9SPHI|nr:hypothetical protein [Sphingobacterium faecale]MBL1410601.1 hypothetical protein [Sphingobacterium faecale]
MYKTISFILLTILTAHIAQAQSALYFDKDWQETTKDKHVYYRPLPLKKEGELLLLIDYYKGGQLQMQGYIMADNPEVYVGDAYWYDEKGFDTGFRQYKNNSSVKELNYYYPDGSLWQTVNYGTNGKKEKITTYLHNKVIATGYISPLEELSGNFSYAQPLSYYEYSPSDEGVMLEKTIAVPTDPVTKTKEQRFYFITVYWENENKASETKVAYKPYGGTAEVYKKTWNKEGKLISERKYNNETPRASYTEEEYYTKNYIATQLRETTPYKNGERYGVSIVYSNNGDTLYRSIFTQDELQELNIYQNNKSIQKNTYRENKPYDGIFTDEMGDVIKEFRLHKGVKIDKEFLKEQDSQKIIAEGVYQNGQPWDGTFFNEGNLFEILQYKNGVQEGIQRAFSNLYFEHIIEEYEMKNGVREGYGKTYDADSLIGESVYRNNQIISGTVREDNLKLTYVNGQVKTRSIYHSRDENRLLSIEEFDNNVLQSVTYFDFTIKEQPKASYTGYFKNQKPFNGFFKLDTLIDDISLVDYYENGILKYKYSFDFIEQLENYEHYLYTVKTTYKDGNPLSGPCYKTVGRERLLQIDYADGKVNRFDVNLFGMHFFARISFQLDNDILSISGGNSPIAIKAYQANQSIIADLYKDDQIFRKGQESTQIKEGSPNSITFYYIKDGQIKTFASSILPFMDEDIDHNDLVMKLYPMFPMNNTTDIQTLLNKFLNKFETGDLEETFEYGIGENFPFKMEDILTTVEFDQNGAIVYGIRPSIQSDGSILIEGIENGKIKKKTTFKSIHELLKNKKAEFKKFEHNLLNDLN